jgi:hypothetical protein
MRDCNQWLLWQYRDHNNCWDFVREVLNKEFNVPRNVLPKFGICPSDKKAMTAAYAEVKQGFVPITEPKEGAIACHFMGDILTHVGVVMNGKVWHASSKHGVRKDAIKTFSRIAKTEYKFWQN